MKYFRILILFLKVKYRMYNCNQGLMKNNSFLPIFVVFKRIQFLTGITNLEESCFKQPLFPELLYIRKIKDNRIITLTSRTFEVRKYQLYLNLLYFPEVLKL